jgi:lipoprotein signal peptidase
MFQNSSLKTDSICKLFAAVIDNTLVKNTGKSFGLANKHNGQVSVW